MELSSSTTDKKRDKKHRSRGLDAKRHSKRERGSYELTKSRRKGRRRRAMSLFLSAFVYVRVYFDYFFDWIWSYFYNHTKQEVKKIQDPLLLESATSLAGKIREGKLKSYDLVEACIKRIDDVNPVLNAVVDKRFKEALKEAKEIDEKIEKGLYTKQDFTEKPFLGVPFTTKESTACKGLRWTFGLVARKHVLADEDAETVRLMKNAGGILLGNTNIPQLNMWVESYNPLYGRTGNPYDTSRNVGGSSGGEACILSAAGSPIGIGTDIGGSIRIPAFMCGIFGHKPTHDLISSKGMTYRKGNEGPSMVTAGPMAKHSEDLAPLLKVLLGDNAKKLKLDERVEKLRVFYCPELNDPLASKIRPEMEHILLRAVENLNDIAVEEPQKVELPNARYSTGLWSFWLRKEPGFDYHRDITDRKSRLSFIWWFVHFASLTGEYTLAVAYNLINFSMPKKDEAWATKTTEDLRNDILSLLGDDGVLICPSGPFPASQHFLSFLRPWNVSYTGIWNFLKLPVTQIPLGLGQEGVPLGVQVVAAPNNDHLCLAVARQLEKTMGGWVPPGGAPQ